MDIFNEKQITEPKQKRGKRKNYSLVVMIGAFIGALIFWIYVLDYDSPDYEKLFSQITIEIRGESSLREQRGYTVISSLEIAADVTVSGRKTDVNKLKTADITAYIDISSVAAPGRQYFEIKTETPNGTEAAGINIQGVYIVIDRYVSSEISVEIELKNYVLPDGITLGEIIISPATVTVNGPESTLLEIENAYASLDLGNVNGSITVNTAVTLKNKNGDDLKNKYIRLADTTVNVHIPIYAIREVPLRVNFAGGHFGTENALISLSAASIMVKGKLENVNALNVINIDIDETGLELFNELTRSIVMPEGIENISGINAVQIAIQLNSFSSRNIQAYTSNFEILNVPEGFSVDLVTKALTVKFFGPYDILKSMTTESYKIIVDFRYVVFTVDMPPVTITAEVVLLEAYPGVYVKDGVVPVTYNIMGE